MLLYDNLDILTASFSTSALAFLPAFNGEMIVTKPALFCSSVKEEV